MKRLIILSMSSVYWVLWTAAIPWFLLALNRKAMRIPALRRVFDPQPSRAFLKSQFKRQTPDQEFGPELAEPDLSAIKGRQS